MDPYDDDYYGYDDYNRRRGGRSPFGGPFFRWW